MNSLTPQQIALIDKQAKKLRELADEFDDVDDDFSDEEITEEEISSVINRPKDLDDIADMISMKSDVEDDESSSPTIERKSFKHKQIVPTTEMSIRRGKNDRLKV